MNNDANRGNVWESWSSIFIAFLWTGYYTRYPTSLCAWIVGSYHRRSLLFWCLVCSSSWVSPISCSLNSLLLPTSLSLREHQDKYDFSFTGTLEYHLYCYHYYKTTSAHDYGNAIKILLCCTSTWYSTKMSLQSADRLFSSPVNTAGDIRRLATTSIIGGARNINTSMIRALIPCIMDNTATTFTHYPYTLATLDYYRRS